MTHAWRPVFSGELAAEMLAIVDDIADATRGPLERPAHIPEEFGPVWECSLDGLAGQSLLQAYLALHGGSEARADAAIALLDQATDAIAALTVPPGLYFGRRPETRSLDWPERRSVS